MKFLGKILWFFAYTIAVIFLSTSAHAQVFHDIPLIGDYPIPESFAFDVSSSCSGHTSIRQATAREDGWFAVCCLCTDSAGQENDIFSLHYVDIYDQNGVFQQELTYRTDLENAIELTEDSLDIYFQTFLIHYDLETGNLAGYSIPSRATVENGLLLDLQRDLFTAGEWDYTLSGGWMDHYRLSRTNGEMTQLLIDYQPFPDILHSPGLWACCGATVALSTILVVSLRRKKILKF